MAMLRVVEIPRGSSLFDEPSESDLSFEQWRVQRQSAARERDADRSACAVCDLLTTTPRHRRCASCPRRFRKDQLDEAVTSTCEACDERAPGLVQPFELHGKQVMLCHDCAVLAAMISPSSIQGLRVLVGESESRREASDDRDAQRRRKSERRSLRRLAHERRRARDACSQGKIGTTALGFL